jgi:hypothetical protein
LRCSDDISYFRTLLDSKVFYLIENDDGKTNAAIYRPTSMRLWVYLIIIGRLLHGGKKHKGKVRGVTIGERLGSATAGQERPS